MVRQSRGRAFFLRKLIRCSNTSDAYDCHCSFQRQLNRKKVKNKKKIKKAPFLLLFSPLAFQNHFTKFPVVLSLVSKWVGLKLWIGKVVLGKIKETSQLCSPCDGGWRDKKSKDKTSGALAVVE